MRVIIRQFLLLVVCSGVVLGVFGWVLFSHQEGARRLEHIGSQVLAPGREHVLSALIGVHALDRELLLAASGRAGDDPVPLRLRMENSLDALSAYLGRIVTRVGDYELEEYGLLARARGELAALRARVDGAGGTEPAIAGRLREELDLLASTLLQLDRVFELAQRRQVERRQEGARTAARSLLVASVLLLVIASPLVIVLGYQLRTALRRELRGRQELEEANHNLQVLAHYDSLTGLGNRHLFLNRLTNAIAQARRDGRSAALMYLDLDHFKRINDSLGHDVGDRVLALIGGRLKETMRDVDTVARIGGDEFTVIASALADAEHARAVAQKLLARIHEPMRIDSREFVLTASIGITMLPHDGTDPTTLMRNADLALYRCKESGRHGFQFFLDEMNRTVVARMHMEAEMREALREGRFDLAYQPQFSLPDGRVECVEALLRWTREDGSPASIPETIHVAENAGLMVDLGGWVLRRACEDIAAHDAAGGPPLRVSVNLSPRQLHDALLLEKVQHVLEATLLPASRLELEITETSLIENFDRAATTLERLRRMGVRVAIDDFGVGYSSLSYLRRLPVDRLKVDRSFVRDIEHDEADRSLVETIVAMARVLSLDVVAEGVENEKQLGHLLDLGCRSVQGYLLAMPRPLEELDAADVSDRLLRLGVVRRLRLRAVE